MSYLKKWVFAGAAMALACGSASADQSNPCQGLPSFSALQSAVQSVVAGGGNGGFGLNMWATVVANDGTVCAVAFSGADFKSQWLASRVISAQKASTANGLSLSNGVTPSGGTTSGGGGFSIGTANLYAAVQPGGSLYGLQFSNPVDPEVAYDWANGKPADSASFGTANDPMVGRRIGGVNIFGGGLALYSKGGIKLGALGVSGDTSCTDHFVAWNIRHNLGYDHFKGVGGPNALVNTTDTLRPDNIVLDVPATAPTNVQGNVGVSASGWGHPSCFHVGNPSSLPKGTND